MDDRIVIPTRYRKEILKQLHSAHQGVTSMKQRANTCVYWPLMNVDLRNIRANCKYCSEMAPRHTKEPLILTADPEYPFQHISADFFQIKGHNYLVMVDRYSSWFTISYFKPYASTTNNLIKECISLFSAYGAPEILSSDGGPQFTSEEFKSFMADWGIKHRVSSPHYPQSNGRAEAAVKSAKRIISDYVTPQNPLDHKAITSAVLQHRNTPLPDLQLSPAQILFHRQLRDKVPAIPKHYHLHKEWIFTAKQREALFEKKNQAMMKQYNQVSRHLQPLTTGTKVLVLSDKRSPRWNASGIVVQCLPFRRYRIRIHGSGRIVIRNRRFLRAYTATYRPHTDKVIYGNDQAQEPEPTTEADDLNDTINQTNGHKILKRIRPFNNPGLLEDTRSIPYRTTRSGHQY